MADGVSRKEDVFALHAEGVLLVPVFPAKHANHVLDMVSSLPLYARMKVQDPVLGGE